MAQLAGSVAEMSAYHHGEVSRYNPEILEKTCIAIMLFDGEDMCFNPCNSPD